VSQPQHRTQRRQIQILTLSVTEKDSDEVEAEAEDENVCEVPSSIDIWSELDTGSAESDSDSDDSAARMASTNFLIVSYILVVNGVSSFD